MRNHRWFAPAAAVGGYLAMRAWNSYRQPWRVPHGYHPRSLYPEVAEAVPALGCVPRLRDFAIRPVATIHRPLAYTASDGTRHYIPENPMVGAFLGLPHRDPLSTPISARIIPVTEQAGQVV